jgi:multidrug efflux system membrane fusion protein
MPLRAVVCSAIPQQRTLPLSKKGDVMKLGISLVVEKEVNEWDEFTGRLEAVESVDIRPRVSGYITEIHFEAGAIIKEGRSALCDSIRVLTRQTSPGGASRRGMPATQSNAINADLLAFVRANDTYLRKKTSNGGSARFF